MAKKAKKAKTAVTAKAVKAAKTVKKLTKARGTAELLMPLKHATADEMLERMFELKRMMESGGAKFSDIKKKFKVSDAQAFLLIKRVRAGFHIDATGIGTGDNRVYSSTGGSRLSLDLIENQVLPALFILRDATERSLAPQMRAAFTFGRTVEKHIDDATRKKYLCLKDRIRLRFTQSKNPSDITNYELFVNAMADGKTLLIDYRSAKSLADASMAGESATPKHKATKDLWHVEPLAMFYARRSFYAVLKPVAKPSATKEAVSDKYSGLRTIRLSRILSVIDGKTNFTMPDWFSLDEYLEDAWEIIREGGEAKSTVVIEVDAAFAVNIKDTLWHPTQEISVRPDGVHEFSFRVRGLKEILYFVLWLGHGARVKQPKSLQDLVKAELKAIAGRY